LAPEREPNSHAQKLLLYVCIYVPTPDLENVERGPGPNPYPHTNPNPNPNTPACVDPRVEAGS